MYAIAWTSTALGIRSKSVITCADDLRRHGRLHYIFGWQQLAYSGTCLAEGMFLAWRVIMKAVAAMACISGSLVGTEVPDVVVLVFAYRRCKMVELS